VGEAVAGGASGVDEGEAGGALGVDEGDEGEAGGVSGVGVGVGCWATATVVTMKAKHKFETIRAGRFIWGLWKDLLKIGEFLKQLFSQTPRSPVHFDL